MWLQRIYKEEEMIQGSECDSVPVGASVGHFPDPPGLGDRAISSDLGGRQEWGVVLG
jgi:hypothetical protein